MPRLVPAKDAPETFRAAIRSAPRDIPKDGEFLNREHSCSGDASRLRNASLVSSVNDGAEALGLTNSGNSGRSSSPAEVKPGEPD